MSIESEMAKLAEEVEAWIKENFSGYEFWLVGHESWKAGSCNTEWNIVGFGFDKCVSGKGKTIEEAKARFTEDVAYLKELHGR